MNPLIQLKRATPIFLVALACFGFSPMAQALLPPPPPDGGYPGQNTAEGDGALFNLTTGVNNTAVGANALLNTTTGSRNAVFGSRALEKNNTGSNNLAVGYQTLFFNTTGDDLTGVGARALFRNTTGFNNTAIGADALSSNTTGSGNTAIGRRALFRNTTGIRNVANGFQALMNNTTGILNSANGYQALLSNTTGDFNSAEGHQALYSNTTGGSNTAMGDRALFRNTTGFNNTAIGFFALANNSSGTGNIALGINAGVSINGDGNIDIGNDGSPGDSGTIRIGNEVLQNRTFIAGIRGTTTELDNAIPVLIDLNGQLGTASSSARFKKEIKPMDTMSEAILALKPVTFYYRSDKADTPQFGLIAEEVAAVNPDLVVRDEKGEVYTVRYDAVNAMLLNEFLKEHKTVQEQGATISELKKELAALTATVKEQAAQIQKVSAQLEVSKPAPQVVNNNQ